MDNLSIRKVLESFTRSKYIRQRHPILFSRAVAALEADAKRPDPAVAAIQFAIELGYEGMDFLRLWNSGEFDVIRSEWPECPKSVFVGADPLLDAPEDSTNG